LEGVTNFGEDISDEWFIVYLLYKLSEMDPNLLITCDDSDGQFLLIEAANHLPKWLDPENSDNRVFIYRAALHIIPLKSGPIQRRNPSLKEAIDCIREYHDLTRAQEDIQNSIKKRIDCYPSRIEEHLHRSHCYVPLGVAALLKHDPTLISSAVQAFYNRTPDDLKVCQAMKYFPPENRVMRCVTFTRCLYAQLMSQRYTPEIKVGWNMPSNDSSDFKSHDLGMKIASGFEILVSNSKSSLDENKDQINWEDDQRWKAFYNSLNKNGYFNGQLFGSKKHKELMGSAQNYFSQLVSASDTPQEFDFYQYYGQKIYNYLRSLDIDENAFRNEEKNLEKEDSDEWMSFSSDELDALLSEKFGSSDQSNNCSEISTKIPETLKSFIYNEKSGIKGAEAPVKASPSKPMRINFNEDSFGDALNTVLSFKIPQSETDSSSSGMSDYSDNEESLDSDDDFYQNDLTNNEPKKNIYEMKSYMKAMDQQLAPTQVGQSFERKNNDSNENTTTDADSNDDYKAVDIDLNALTNILESYKNEAGNAGPATALFASMGVKLPDNADSD
jgi:hypothetical protein